jgi:transposase
LTGKPQRKERESTMRRYDAQTKIESVALSKEIGAYKASQELGIPEGTLRTWMEKERNGELPGSPGGGRGALSLSDENKQLRQKVRELERTNRILREASAFFAARQKK